MPHSTLTWRTFRLSILALSLACGHAVAAGSRPTVSTHKGGAAARGPAQNSAPRTPPRFVGVGPTAIASSGVRLDAESRVSMPMTVSQAAQRPPAAAPPATPVAMKDAQPAAPTAAQAQPKAPSSVAAAAPKAQPASASGAQRNSRRSSMVTAALSRRPSGGVLHRDPFGSVSPLALGR